MFTARIHIWLFAAGMGLIAMALPSSVYFMSVGQLLLGANWLLEGRYREKLRLFFSHTPALIFSGIFLVYLPGLLLTSDFPAAFREMEQKLPFLTMPLLLVTAPPMPRGLRPWLFTLFSGSIAVVSLIGYIQAASDPMAGFRDLSPFISHIRMSLMALLSVWLMGLQASKTHDAAHPFFLLGLSGKGFRIFSGLLAFWNMHYFLMLQSLSGLFALIVSVHAVVFFLALAPGQNLPFKKLFFRLSAAAGWLLLNTLLVFFILSGFWRMISVEHSPDEGALPELTQRGMPYSHNTDWKQRENGHLVFAFVAEEELAGEWPGRSEMDFMGTDLAGQPLRYTLYRFMSSKGLKKDAAGLAELADYEIRAVEKGIANVHYLHRSDIWIRIHQTVWEVHQYLHLRNPQGHSLAQRIELWRASLAAFKQKPLLGWGTGDLLVAMRFGLDRIESPLEFAGWKKPHNQYLSLALQFGLTGLIWILLALVAPLYLKKQPIDPGLLVFLAIALSSMLNEDTWGTQAGLSFFVFFYTVFVFLPEKEQNNATEA